MDNGAGYNITGPCACPLMDESLAKYNGLERQMTRTCSSLCKLKNLGFQFFESVTTVMPYIK